MTRRRWLLVALAVIVIAVVARMTLSWKETRRGELTYSVTAPDTGRLEATLEDGRPGKHTVWLVLHDSPEGEDRRLLNLFSDGDTDAENGERIWVSRRLRLHAGVYRYGVYSVDRLYVSDDPKYWTAEYRVAEGQVTVP